MVERLWNPPPHLTSPPWGRRGLNREGETDGALADQIRTRQVPVGADGQGQAHPLDGVHNFQAALNMKAMKEGDRAFFYHSNEGKEIVGVVEIVRAFYPNPDEPSRISASSTSRRWYRSRRR